MSKDTIIFDLDGTLALDDHRSHHLKGEVRNWEAYFDACEGDYPNEAVIEVLRAVAKTHIVLIMSGRSDRVADKTRGWLRAHNIPYHSLRMRPAEDRTQDDELKIGWAKEYGLDQILCVFEDRNRVVAAWRAAGVPCFQVALTTF